MGGGESLYGSKYGRRRFNGFIRCGGKVKRGGGVVAEADV